MTTEKLIYMAHPVRGDVAVNRLRAMLWLKWITLETKATVIAPWITDVALWDEGDDHLRELGLLKCQTTLVRCDELWMVSGWGASDGMKREATWAVEKGLHVVDASMMPAPWEYQPDAKGGLLDPTWDIQGDPMAMEIVQDLLELKAETMDPKCRCTIPRGSSCGRCFPVAAPRYPGKDTPSDALLAPEDTCYLCRIGTLCEMHRGIL